ncbi:unnamed protein product [Brassica oleracea]
MGHFRIKKTYKVVYEHFYWPSLMKDVERICNRCVVCKKAKSKVKNQDDPNLWTNPFEERGNDAPQSMDQYMEPHQIGDQTDQNNSAEVRLPTRANQDDRAVYRLDPLTSGMELRPDTRPDIRTDRSSTRSSQPSRQAKANSRAILDLDLEVSQNDRDFSLLVRLARTKCPKD